MPPREFLTEERGDTAVSETVAVPEEHLPSTGVLQQIEDAVVNPESDCFIDQQSGEFLESIFTSHDKRASPTDFLMMTSDSSVETKPNSRPLIVELNDCGPSRDRPVSVVTETDSLLLSHDTIQQLATTVGIVESDDEFDSVE